MPATTRHAWAEQTGGTPKPTPNNSQAQSPPNLSSPARATAASRRKSSIKRAAELTDLPAASQLPSLPPSKHTPAAPVAPTASNPLSSAPPSSITSDAKAAERSQKQRQNYLTKSKDKKGRFIKSSQMVEEENEDGDETAGNEKDADNEAERMDIDTPKPKKRRSTREPTMLRGVRKSERQTRLSERAATPPKRATGMVLAPPTISPITGPNSVVDEETAVAVPRTSILSDRRGPTSEVMQGFVNANGEDSDSELEDGYTEASVHDPAEKKEVPDEQVVFIPFFKRKDFVPAKKITGNESWAREREWDDVEKRFVRIDHQQLWLYERTMPEEKGDVVMGSEDGDGVERLYDEGWGVERKDGKWLARK